MDGGEELVARLVVRLASARFFDQICDQLCNSFSTFLVDVVPKTGQKPEKKTEKHIFEEKGRKKDQKVRGILSFWGAF